MQDYKVTIDDKEPITGPTCNFWGVPHRDFEMKVPTSKAPKKKTKQQGKQAGGARGGSRGARAGAK